MKSLAKITAAIIYGLSTFTIFPADNQPKYSNDPESISKQANKITEQAWKMTGDALRGVMGLDRGAS